MKMRYGVIDIERRAADSKSNVVPGAASWRAER